MKRNILLFGGIVTDRYYFVDRWPPRGGDGLIGEQAGYVGGCAVNMAATIRNLGGAAYVISYIGRDSTGNAALRYLENQGLYAACVRQCDAESGYCLVFVEPDGERTFLTKEGCEGRFSRDLLPVPVMSGAAVAAVTGYYLLGEYGPAVMDVVETLAADGCTVLFDPSPLVSEIDAPVLARILACAQVLTPNAEEAQILAGGGNGDIWARRTAAFGKTVVLKQGASGGLVYRNEHSWTYRGFPPPAPAVDSTGAGDSFAGALAWALAEELGFSTAVEIAARCAAETVAIKGPHGRFSTEWVNELLARPPGTPGAV